MRKGNTNKISVFQDLLNEGMEDDVNVFLSYGHTKRQERKEGSSPFGRSLLRQFVFIS